MSFNIRFDQDERKAFSRGLIKGMAAPLMLFANSPVPVVPSFEPLELPNSANQTSAALAGDWIRVGRDLGTVVQRHNGAK